MVSRSDLGFKFSSVPGVSVSIGCIGFLLCVYTALFLFIYLVLRVIYKFDIIKFDEAGLARIYLSRTLCSKAVVIKFQPIVHSSKSKIVALECLCRINEKEDSAPQWIVDLSDDMYFDLFKASYFAIKRNVDNGINDIVRVYTINMSAGSVIKYQHEKHWAALSKLVGVRLIIELSSINVENETDIKGAMSNLKKIGYRFMLDNYFDDEVSINLLLTLPVDYLKVGRGFVKKLCLKEILIFY